jgi:hypothetical protein
MADVDFKRLGGLVLLEPRTEAAKVWLAHNADCSIRRGRAIALARRHAAQVVADLARAGFAVAA